MVQPELSPWAIEGKSRFENSPSPAAWRGTGSFKDQADRAINKLTNPEFNVKWSRYREVDYGSISIGGVRLFGGIVCGSIVLDLKTSSSPTAQKIGPERVFMMIVDRGRRVANFVFDSHGVYDASRLCDMVEKHKA